jgi:hypothetical protein
MSWEMDQRKERNLRPDIALGSHSVMEMLNMNLWMSIYASARGLGDVVEETATHYA